jgi:hypothetical protein
MLIFVVPETSLVSQEKKKYILKLYNFGTIFPVVYITDEFQLREDSSLNYLNSTSRFNASFQQGYAPMASIESARSFTL